MIIGRSDQRSLRRHSSSAILVNYTAPDSSEALTCHGPLRGFKMTTDRTCYRGYVYGNWEPIAAQAI